MNRSSGRPRLSQMAYSLVFMLPWCGRSGVHAPLFYGHTDRCSMCLQVCGVDHHGLLLTVVRSEACHHTSENALSAPTPPTALKASCEAIGGGCITPAQAIADTEDNPADNPPVINTWLAVGLWEIGSETFHLHVGQPEKVAHVTAPFPSRESHSKTSISAP